MALTTSTVHSTSYPLDSSDLFEVIYEVDEKKRHKQLKRLIDQYSCFYDRFIFLYAKEDTRFETYIFKSSFTTGKEVEKKKYLYPLVYSDLNYSKPLSPPLEGIFEFVEAGDRLIQLVGLTYEQAFSFFLQTTLKSKLTCVVLVNVDRLGYRTSTLLQFYTSLLPYFSRLWGYLFLTQNQRSFPFYQWLALHLGKTATILGKTELQEVVQSWKLMTIGEIPLDTEEDSYLPRKFNERITKECKGITGIDVLFTNASREKKEFYIQAIRSHLFDTKHWNNLRRLLLIMLIDRNLVRGKKMLVVTNSIDDTSWTEYWTEESFLEYPHRLTPKFWPVDDVDSLRHEDNLNQYDHVILDFGDELTPWLSTPVLRNILEHTAIIQGLLRNTEVTFFYPFLLVEEVIEWLLTRPPVPSSLAKIEESKLRNRELRFISILLAAIRRTWKHQFYHEIGSSWLLAEIDEEDKGEEITELVRKLRFTGFLERRHFHTTALGRFFLNYELAISPYLDHLQEHLPSLFIRALSEKRMSEELFSQFYVVSSKWFFQATKKRGFGVGWLSEFQNALRHACRTEKLPSTLRDTVIYVLTNQVSQEIIKQKKYPRVKKYFKRITTRLEELKYRNPKSLRWRKIHFGAAFVKALKDVQRWKDRLEDRERWVFKDPYFSIRERAKRTKNPEEGISESSYIRAISRIFLASLADRRTSVYLERIEKQYPTLQGKLRSKIKLLRQEVALRKVRVHPRRDVLALVLIRSPSSREAKFEFLNRTCQECWYFNSRRKMDCSFFEPLIHAKKTRVPPTCKARFSFISSKMVGCPIWRPREPTLLELPFGQPIRCVHCFHPLPTLRKPREEHVCRCETKYRSLDQEDPTSHFIECQLTENHEIRHDLAILFDRPIEKIRVHRTKRSELQFRSQQVYTPERDGSLEIYIQQPSQYLFIRATDKLKYDSETKQLTIGRKSQPSDTIDLKKIRFIDSQKKVNPLRTAVHANPHIIINLRKYNLTLSPRRKGQDRATIIWEGISSPVLKVTRHRKIKPEYYPLHQIISMYNVGKPRLTPLLKDWGIVVINRSIKGIRSRPIEVIDEALALKGVRPLLSEIHLLGLVISSIRATARLVELADIYNQPTLGEKLTQHLKSSLYQAPDHLYDYYQQMKAADTSSTLLRCRLEAWITHPFADGIRQFVKKVQAASYPLIHRSYGRTFARRLRKRSKQEYAYRGAYTKYDAALNSINRTLRHRLRIWNAKAGLGFYSNPLFSHISKDKPGLAAHLDLEEAGRIISRLVLAQAIATRSVHGGQFGAKQDEDNFYYYFPWDWTQQILRGKLVNQRILQQPLRYNQQWLPYSLAHRTHIDHLCEVLRTCVSYSTTKDRLKYLLCTYTPLIYSSTPPPPGITSVWNEVRTLFEFCWIERAQKLFQRKNLGINGLSFPLINPHLISRLLPPSV